MSDLQVNCPSCGCPGQHVGLSCGFCHARIPVPDASLSEGGTLKVEEVIGYRAWKVNRDKDGTPILVSPLYAMDWIPGQWMIAECRIKGDQHSPTDPDKVNWPPVKGCGGGAHGCGFYAGRTREHLVQLGYGKYTDESPHVIGRVQMAGKLIPASNGWRAQKVRPRTIYVPYEMWELARDLKAVYAPHGVEVDVSTTLVLPKKGEGAIEWCRKCSAKMGRSTTCQFCGYNHT